MMILNSHYIYEIQNILNGKTYIGQHLYRSESKEEYLGSGNLIMAAVKKYGRDVFRKRIILADIVEQEEANSWEIYFIARNRKIGKAEYNIAKGGRSAGGALSCPSIRAKAAETFHNNYIKNGPTEGQRRQAEFIRNMEHKRGYKQSSEWINKRAEARRGKPGVNWKKDHPETLAKIVANHRKPVQCVETGMIFESVNDACRYCGLATGAGISNCINGKQKRAGGYHWIKIEKETT